MEKRQIHLVRTLSYCCLAIVDQFSNKKEKREEKWKIVEND